MKSKCLLRKEFEWKAAVQADVRVVVIKENHSEPTAAHLSVTYIHKRLALHYF